MANNQLKELIDQAIDLAGAAGKANMKRRHYLGGSQMGHKCNRNRWYSFHWAIKPYFKPLMLRIFDRGHREEERMIGWLEMIGCEVQAFDPDTIPELYWDQSSDTYEVVLPIEQMTDPTIGQALGKYPWQNVTGTWHEYRATEVKGIILPEPRQFHWVAIDGHHMGNSDGRARNVPGQELFGVPRDQWLLTEFKTHNEKSFVNVEAFGVFTGKPEHYIQMQRYMHKLQLPLGIYGAVNKNNDDLYFEFIPIDLTMDLPLDETAKVAIYSVTPPDRISSSASWFECKWCDFRAQCHFGAPLDKNCRSCKQSTPVSDGRWHCSRWDKLIPKEAEEAGCGFWTMRTD